MTDGFIKNYDLLQKDCKNTLQKYIVRQFLVRQGIWGYIQYHTQIQRQILMLGYIVGVYVVRRKVRKNIE